MSDTLQNTVVIFDLDGTLVDSAPDLCATLNMILTDEGLEPVALEQVRHLVGNGALAMMKKGFELQGRPYPEGAQGERLRANFIDHYADHSTDHSEIFAGCLSCLDELQSMGAALAVCTNKIERLTFPMLEKLQLTSYFAEIICRDSLPEYKPSGLPLKTILQRTSVRRGIMVGDTQTDLDAARAAAMPCALATFGYGQLPDDLYANEQKFDHYDELITVVKQLNGQ